MDPLMLARVQFGLTAGTHFLFVALTLGLATLVALVQTRAAVTGGAVHERMTRFWGQLYVINYAVGIVTGLVMEFQFGLNWGGMTKVTGGVFGAPLAMETIVAFFVESTFLGLWIFGWDRLNRWVHLALIWVVTLTAYLSAYFVLVANGWLQRPVGYEMRDGVARLTDLGALLTNPCGGAGVLPCAVRGVADRGAVHGGGERLPPAAADGGGGVLPAVDADRVADVDPVGVPGGGVRGDAVPVHAADQER